MVKYKVTKRIDIERPMPWREGECSVEPSISFRLHEKRWCRPYQSVMTASDLEAIAESLASKAVRRGLVTGYYSHITFSYTTEGLSDPGIRDSIGYSVELSEKEKEKFIILIGREIQKWYARDRD